MIKVVVDSTADIPAALREQYDITVVPVLAQFGNQTFRDDVDITRDEFYARLIASPEPPKTAAPSAGMFEEAFRRAAADGGEVLSISLAGALSGTYNAARQGAQLVEGARIVCVDSKTATMSFGFLAIHAAQAIRDGASAPEVALLINALIQHCHVVFFVDTIEYLEHTGRLSLATSVVGSMQRIKPLMLLDEGEIVPYERTRTRAKAIEGLYTFIEDFPHVQEVIALYSTTPEDVEKLLEKVDPIFPRDQVQIMQFGPSIGAHLGPGAMGAAVFEGLD